jgi:hypothetical protein
MMAAIASWGIRPEFIYRPATSSTDRANVVRSFATMTGDAGGWKWWGHCHYPDGESHWDPGRVNLSRFFAAAYGGTVTPPPIEEDDMPYSPEQIKQMVRDVMAEEATAVELFTGHGIVKDVTAADPETADRVTPSYLLEVAAAAKPAAVDVDALATALVQKLPGGTGQLTKQDVEDVVRSVLGSVDNSPSAT